MDTTLIDAYDALISSDTLRADERQAEAVEELQDFYSLVCLRAEESGGLFKRVFSPRRDTMPRRCGVYMWGGVGRGKSMLMDLFYNIIPLEQKKRMHFHAFMRDIHARIHAWRQYKNTDDIIARIVERELAHEYRLLCLDELQVTDVTDAMILAQLFAAMFAHDIRVVFTSNRPPAELYQGGLQREEFEKFIALIDARMNVVELDSPTDYRLEQIRAFDDKVYHYPLGVEADEFIYQRWCRLTKNHGSQSQIINVSGRRLVLEKTCSDVAWVTFDELCARPLGAGDYIEIARLFHTLLMQNIPTLTPECRNEARRFVTLIDALYEHNVILICSAVGVPEALYPSGDGSFEFERTASRLIEMQSEKYLGGVHKCG